MKEKVLAIVICYLVLLFSSNNLMAGDEKSDVYVLEDITVTGELICPTRQTGDSLYTGTSVTRKGIELMGTPAKTSVYNVLDIIPGLNVESKDPYGLSGTDIRIRGAKGYYIGMTVEGIPNYGIMPIGAREDIYDMENMESVSLYKGASPADLGTGSGNRGGSIELQLRRPEDKLGIELGQSFGSKDFVRTFLRIDSGELSTKTKLFGSYSYTDANKWKGKGDLGGRDHVTLGLNQQFGDVVNIDLFYNFNEIEKHFFKSLNYEQADHINHDDNFYHHYNNELTSDPKKDINYYDYNRGKFINRDFMSIIDINISEKFNLSLKPYYSSEDAKFWEGKEKFPVMMGSEPEIKPGVLNKIRELERYGVIPEINFDISGFGITAGYWFESHDLEKYVKRYVTTPAGLQYNGYLYYAKNDGHGEIHSPYAKLSYELNKFKFQAGLKYFYYEEPASTGYTSDAALNLKEDPDISLKETDYDEVLPTFGIGYEFTENTKMYLNYGRNYMRPYAYVPTTNTYAINKKQFTDANMTLQDIFDDWEMETSDNFDLSFRYSRKYFSIAPVFFYSEHSDLLASIDDPRIMNHDNTPVAYYQNVGDATTYGFELELNFYPSKNLIVYFNPSYTDMSFDDDFKRGDKTLKIEGNQIPDTPKWIVKSGLIYTINNFEISPTVKWIGSRYGDALNKERIDDYAVVDLNLGYTIDDFWGLREAKIGLELNNLFNKRYVGAIEASDTGTSADYYAGSPFTAIFTVSGKF